MNTGMVSLNSLGSEHAMNEMSGGYSSTAAIDYSTGSANHHMHMSAAAGSPGYEGYSASGAEPYSSTTGATDHVMENGKMVDRHYEYCGSHFEGAMEV